MKLHECKLGEIVVENYSQYNFKQKPITRPKIGHIIGLFINSLEEVIPIVRWASKDKVEETPIHHMLIDILK